MEKQSFDFEAFKKQAATRVKNGDTLLGKEGVLTPLLKEFLEGALEGELEAHIEESEEANRKNGKGKKRVKTPVGAVDIALPVTVTAPLSQKSSPSGARHLGSIWTGRLSRCMPGEPVMGISATIYRRCMIWMCRRLRSVG